VTEDKNYEDFSCTLLPGSTTTDDSHRVAMKMIQFKSVDVFKIPLPVKPTKVEREYITSVRIVKNTKILEPVQIAYLEPPPDA
jgi:hypothetical protein